MITNGQWDFRACVGAVEVISKDEVRLPSEVAEALKVDVGDGIRFVSLYPSTGKKGHDG